MALIQLRINVGSKGRVQRGHKLVKDGDRPDAAWTVVNVEDDESLVEREIPIPAGKSLADVEASVPGKGVVLRIVWEP
jgi:hypothetical protein